jgi:serine/threonine protein kinase
MGDPTVAMSVEENFGDELRPGTQLLLGQYTIERFLNAGGFGITYLATNSLGRRVVIKECFPSALCGRSDQVVRPRSRAYKNNLSSVVQLFVQEAHNLAKLAHPNIVGVHQVFEDNDTAYMVLDYIEGRDLEEIASDSASALSPAEVRTILIKMLDAVGYVHSAGLLHRDISPDNILLDAKLNPFLIDFGAAREEIRKEGRALSAIRVVKDGYSPQEMYVAGSAQWPSSDLYALAATFYHIITGATPADSQVRLAALAGNSPDPYVPLAGRFDAYEPTFLAAIDKCLSVLPRDRHQTAEQWLAAISGLDGSGAKVLRLRLPESAQPLGGIIASSAAATDHPEPDTSRKLPLLAVLGGAVVVAAVGAFVLLQDKPAAVAAPALTDAVASVAEPTTAVAAETVVETAPAAPVAETVVEAAPAAPVAEPVVVVAPVAEAVVEASPAAPLAEPGVTELSPVMSHWAFDLPFTVAIDDPAAIGEILGVVPEWVKPGLRIVAVNGTEIRSIAEMPKAVQADVNPEDMRAIAVTLTTRDAKTGAPAEHVIELPVIQQTLLLNGIRIQGRKLRDKWQESVAALPNGYEGELKIGDVLVAHVGSDEAIDKRHALAEILERSVKAGLEQDAFAVLRDGALWVVTIPLPKQ